MLEKVPNVFGFCGEKIYKVYELYLSIHIDLERIMNGLTDEQCLF